MLSFDWIPKEIKHLTQEVMAVTTLIKSDLQSDRLKTAEEYASAIVPAVDPLYKSVLALCDTALKACVAIQAFDWDGVEGRLSRLVSNVVAVKHGNQHGIGLYCTYCQAVINWILKKDN